MMLFWPHPTGVILYSGNFLVSCLQIKGKISLQECNPFYSPEIFKQVFSGGSVVKILRANAGDTSVTPVPGRSHVPWGS